MARVGGKTPDRVVELLRQAVEGSSQSAVARDTGLRLYSVQRYLKGIGEPSQETFDKLAAYFGVSVEWLRGYGDERSRPWDATVMSKVHLGLLRDVVELYGVVPKNARGKLSGIASFLTVETETIINFHGAHLDQATCHEMESLVLQINGLRNQRGKI